MTHAKFEVIAKLKMCTRVRSLPEHRGRWPLLTPLYHKGVSSVTVCVQSVWRTVVRWPVNDRLSHNAHSIQAQTTVSRSSTLVALSHFEGPRHSLCLEHSWCEV